MTSASRPPESSAATRFAFGRNWSRFVERISDQHVTEAERSLTQLLPTEAIAGKRFLDVGSGSGLSSLAALRLGAAAVHSFDYDNDSVETTRALKARWASQQETWTIERGDILDSSYLDRLGQWDVVYSWGVLHHTGNLRQALENAGRLVAPGGRLFIAIYNDQGWRTHVWTTVKRLYHANRIARGLVLAVFIPYFAGATLLGGWLRGQGNPFRAYAKHRGMSPYYDWIDWLGGYPFEVAKPEALIAMYAARGFSVERQRLCGNRLGCNELVFKAPLTNQSNGALVSPSATKSQPEME